MLVSRKSKFKPKFAAIFFVVTLVVTAGVASAANVTAFLDGSSNYKNTSILTASYDSTGSSIYVTNSGQYTTTKGYAKRSISWWPDSTLASTSWLNPRQSQTVRFAQKKGHKYYGQIVGQTRSARGSVSLTVY